jgi:flagellar hook-basal body complex protein FliE
MSITPIQALEAPVLPEIAPLTMPATEGPGFASMVAGGVDTLEQKIHVAEEGVARFATGEDIPPHQVMLALEDARLSLQFALQVRTRLVEGFQELMRMQL